MVLGRSCGRGRRCIRPPVAHSARMSSSISSASTNHRRARCGRSWRGEITLLVHVGTIWVHGTLTEVPVTEDVAPASVGFVRNSEGGDRKVSAGRVRDDRIPCRDRASGTHQRSRMAGREPPGHARSRGLAAPRTRRGAAPPRDSGSRRCTMSTPRTSRSSSRCASPSRSTRQVRLSTPSPIVLSRCADSPSRLRAGSGCRLTFDSSRSSSSPSHCPSSSGRQPSSTSRAVIP